MPKRRYKSYLLDELASVPRTTKWRKQNELYTTLTSQDANESEDTSSDHSFSSDNDLTIGMSNEGSLCSDTHSDTSSELNDTLNSNYDHCQEESFSNSEEGDVQNSSISDDSSHDDTVYEEDGQENNFGIDGEDELLYEGASLTQKQSILLLMSFVLKHHLTDNALNDFLTVMNLHFPNVVPESKYLFYKKFHLKKFERHYFCPECTHYFGSYEATNSEDKCSCHHSNSPEIAKASNWYFSYWKLESQLQLLLQNDTIADHLLNKPRDANTTLKDACDGKIYENLRDIHGYGMNDISLLWNVDGVPVFKSSTQDLWPIQCMIMELPVKLRQQHILMPAFWCAKSKVEVSLLLKPFVAEIQHLSTEGFIFNGYRIRVFAPICTTDAIARPKLNNTKQFNGMYGCDWCLHPGREVERGRGTARVYPYEGCPPLRTHESTERRAVEAIEKVEPQKGVKGPSLLSSLYHFDLVNSFVPDFLHCSLLGVARQLVTLWFASTNHTQQWYIGQPTKQALYDSRLMGIVVPKEVRRLPRSITTREHWKANEFKTFVLYFSLIILQDLLPSLFLNHFFLFVWSLHRLLGTNITPNDLVKVEAVLNYFILRTGELYGESHCTFNIHQLSHLSTSTKMCGPLWAVSTFLFESNNAVLKNMIQGTQFIPDQICNDYTTLKALPYLMKQIVGENEFLTEILEEMVCGKTKTKNAVQLSDGLLALSKPKVRYLSEEEIVATQMFYNYPINRVVYEYNRFLWNGKLYDTSSYTRASKRKNCFVKVDYEGNVNYCQLQSLMMIKQNCTCEISHHEQCECPRDNLLLCSLFDVVDNQMFKWTHFNIVSDFLCKVELTPRLLCIGLGSIVTKCIKVVKCQLKKLVEMPNMLEME